MPRHELLLQELFETVLGVLSTPARAFDASLRPGVVREDSHAVHVDLSVFELSRHLKSSFHVLGVDSSIETICASVCAIDSGLIGGDDVK